MSTQPLYIHPHAVLAPTTTGVPAAAPSLGTSTSSKASTSSNINTSTSNLGTAFGAVLDTINPLQHIPVVSSVYRSLTGSTISSGSQIAGDALYGALLGGGTLVAAAVSGVASAADVGVQQTTGNGVAGHVLSTVGITTPPTTLASIATTANTTVSANTSTLPQLVPIKAGSASAASTTSGTQSAIALHHPDTIASHYKRAAALDSVNQYLTSVGGNQPVRKFKDTAFN